MLVKSIFFCLLFLPLNSLAEPVQVQVDIRHRPPEMSIIDGKYYGPLIDIIDLLLLESKLEPQWLVVPWPRTLLRAKLGQVDIIPRHSMTLERKKFLLPMLIGYEQRSVHYLLSPSIQDIDQYQSPKQFSNLIFGLLRGSYYGPYIENIQSKVSTVFTHDIQQLMSLLLSGRIDIMPIQNLSWAKAAFHKVKHKHKAKMYQISSYKETFVSGKYISIPKSSPLATSFHRLNCQIFKLRNSGTIDSIYQDYDISPYLQILDNAESLEQVASCLKTDSIEAPELIEPRPTEELF